MIVPYSGKICNQEWECTHSLVNFDYPPRNVRRPPSRSPQLKIFDEDSCDLFFLKSRLRKKQHFGSVRAVASTVQFVQKKTIKQPFSCGAHSKTIPFHQVGEGAHSRLGKRHTVFNFTTDVSCPSCLQQNTHRFPSFTQPPKAPNRLLYQYPDPHQLSPRVTK